VKEIPWTSIREMSSSEYLGVVLTAAIARLDTWLAGSPSFAPKTSRLERILSAGYSGSDFLHCFYAAWNQGDGTSDTMMQGVEEFGSVAAFERYVMANVTRSDEPVSYKWNKSFKAPKGYPSNPTRLAKVVAYLRTVQSRLSAFDSTLSSQLSEFRKEVSLNKGIALLAKREGTVSVAVVTDRRLTVEEEELAREALWLEAQSNAAAIGVDMLDSTCSTDLVSGRVLCPIIFDKLRNS
jgi:hypothetical protein